MNLEALLRDAVEKKASDIFIIAGGFLSCKLAGEICPLGGERLTPADTKDLIDEIYAVAGRKKELFEKEGDDDFSFAIGQLARFRVSEVPRQQLYAWLHLIFQTTRSLAYRTAS